jgi:histidine ammonia-lyase
VKEIILDGESLTFEKVRAAAYGEPGKPRVVLSARAKKKIERCAKDVGKLVGRGEIAYGITTGFGAFKDKIISPKKVEELQKNILLSHAVGVGEPFDIPTTRAIMLIRANTLARGYSGIRLETLDLLLEFLNLGIHPVIPEKGSLGASGDLAPLAHMACPLIGEGKAEFEGEILNGKDALKKAGLKPVTLAAKEGLALTNGTTIMTAVGLLETHKAKKLAEIADIAGCLSLEALRGTTLAFDKRIHALRKHKGQKDCAANLLKILKGSEFVRGFDPKDIQDSYTLRCMPQVHGACRDSIDYAERVVDTELNAVTDNPLIFADGDVIEVISGGNFHGEPLALSMDFLAIALTELGNISERRIMKLNDPATNNKLNAPFLIQGGGLNSGFMIVQYTAAALCSENKVFSHPASADTIPSSANVEDHVSMGVTSVLKLRRIVENLEYILALELFCAAQGVDFRKKKIGAGKSLGSGTRKIYDRIRSRVPFIKKDEYMKTHIDTMIGIVREMEN